jgi:undecaprenyl pyrophosphate phosphatase UppP
MTSIRKETAPKELFILWGFLLWLGATIIFHFFGGMLMNAEHRVAVAISFVAAVPVIFACTVPMYAAFKVAAADRLWCAAYIALPGMLLDIVSLSFHRTVFPTISLDSVPTLSAWLMWAYSLILLTGFLRRK